MSSERPALVAESLGKMFRGYPRAIDRLHDLLLPLRRLLDRNARTRARSFRALHDVNLKVQRGETLGIIGRNGSGKSTLLQIVCGTMYPSSGRVEVNGRIAALLELGAGFEPELSGRDNVFFCASLYGLGTADTARRLPQIEAFAEIGEYIDRPVKTYSSGMLVRLGFAVIAHVDADILVIDEALAVGDAYFSLKCMNHLRRFAATGTLIFVSHDTGAVKALCDRVVWLDQGRVRREGGAKEVCEAYLESEFPQRQSRATRAQAARTEPTTARRDQRHDFINASNLRNDLRVFPFDPDTHGIGASGASIVDVGLFDDHDRELAWVVGGETVRLRIRVECHADLASAVVGFMVKDRVAQPLFGDNTYLSRLDEPLSARAGEVLEAAFEFEMPRLPNGDYAVIVAIADGDQQRNVQHHWMHDALRFRSECSSVSSGMIGLPMHRISLDRAPPRPDHAGSASGDDLTAP